MRLYTFNSTANPPTIEYSYVTDAFSERQESKVEITMECLPCLFNCNGKCAEGYFLESTSNRCYLKCPAGWTGVNATGTEPRKCIKLTAQNEAIIRSSRIGANGRFINSNGI